ncbi:outer membrane protein assembly factor BamE, partial [Thermodesulfobacteriota bacterium]
REPSGKDEDKDNGWWNNKSWRKLKEGMSREQVKKILGEPVKAIKGHREIWYYPNFYRGHVSFDEDGNLRGWNEP